MCDSSDSLDQIAQGIGTIIETQEGGPDPDDESEDNWDPEDYHRDMEDYDGGW